MKALTVAGWRRLLARYEELVLNPALGELTADERSALFKAHDVLRLRAIGGSEHESS